MDAVEAAREVSSRWDHSDGAIQKIAPHILAAAKLLDLRIIVDVIRMGKNVGFAIVRRPRKIGGPPDAPRALAYVHVQMRAEWLTSDTAWYELLSHLWPGY